MCNDTLGLNSVPRNIEFKVFLDKDYSGFGCTFEHHKKYLPCYAIVQRLSGDSFYDFDLITDEGIIHSCGYEIGMKKYKEE